MVTAPDGVYEKRVPFKEPKFAEVRLDTDGFNFVRDY
jgi:hypothetical protein